MRIALISDLHSNLVSLEAVLADIQEMHADQIVCLGDVAAFGPQPREVIARLQSLGCPAVMGNMDTWVLSPKPFKAQDKDALRMEEVDRWCVAQLTSADKDYMRTFQPTVELQMGQGASLLCYHGSPQSATQIILSTTPEADLDHIFADCRALVLAGGHTHTQMLRRYKDKLIINPGSVGLPPEQTEMGQKRHPAWAEYALLTCGSKLGVELRRVPVDVRAIRRGALESGMPHAQWWLESWPS